MYSKFGKSWTGFPAGNQEIQCFFLSQKCSKSGIGNQDFLLVWSKFSDKMSESVESGAFVNCTVIFRHSRVWLSCRWLVKLNFFWKKIFMLVIAEFHISWGLVENNVHVLMKLCTLCSKVTYSNSNTNFDKTKISNYTVSTKFLKRINR